MESRTYRERGVDFNNVTGTYAEVYNYCEVQKTKGWFVISLLVSSEIGGAIAKLATSPIQITTERKAHLVIDTIVGRPSVVDAKVMIILAQYPTPEYGTWVESRNGLGDGNIEVVVRRFAEE